MITGIIREEKYEKNKGISIAMITRNIKEKSKQIQIVSIDQLVPEDHLLRKIDENIDFSFIYDLVKDRYCEDNGRPSIDPVTLIKIPMIQYLYGIRSMRQTVKDIEVNVAYRWFLGLDFFDDVPHFTTFGKNYKRRFEGTDLFEQIFSNILNQCMENGYVDTKTVYVDSTHVKARANRNKYVKVEVAKKEAMSYEKQLRKEIDSDREIHGKKPLKDKKDDSDDNGSKGGTGISKVKEIRQSTTDPESGWFRKGEHKEVFAYSIQTACDSHGWILGYEVNPGNDNDKRTFPSFYEKIKPLGFDTLVADRGYKSPSLAKMMIDDGVVPVLPYTRPMSKEGFFYTHEYVYDEYYDCYLCPEGQILRYSTTNKDGYREYKSDPDICANCPNISRCTLNKKHQKLVTRHVWRDYLDVCEDIRHDLYYKEIYKQRKETIERVFGTAKEMHGMRYTHMIGKEKMSMKVGLTYACMNMKKLANMLSNPGKKGKKSRPSSSVFSIFLPLFDSLVIFCRSEPKFA